MTSSAAFPRDVDHRREVLAAVGRASGHDGAAVVGARLLDADVDLLVVADQAEHTRRIAHCAALDEWELLRVLTSLPRWEPVPLSSLTAEDRHVVRDAPHGAVEIADGTVTRLAGPPLTRVLAVVTDTDWDRGLNVASRFAPVATRVLVLEGEPSELAVAAAEASEYGIGLALDATNSVRMVVSPVRWREKYVSPGGWLFREQAYRAYLDQTAVTPMMVTGRG